MNKNKIEEATAKFEKGYSCSQAIFSTYSASQGMDHDTALKISDAFGGGMGGLGRTCGAVTGAMMSIGLLHGRTNADDDAAKQKTRSLIKEFVKQFEAIYGTTTCNQLTGYDINDPIQNAEADEKGVYDEKCPGFIKTAADILEKLTS